MKTIKDGLDEAYKNTGANAYFGNGFNEGVKFAQQWILVKDELPEYYKPVNIKINQFITTAWLACSGDKYIWTISGSDITLSSSPTHWRPIEFE